MIHIMAQHRAGAAKKALIDETHITIGAAFCVEGVEIDQVRVLLHPVRIVAGGAGGLLINDVLAMSFKALVGKDAVAIMTFITEGVDAEVFSVPVSQH